MKQSLQLKLNQQMSICKHWWKVNQMSPRYYSMWKFKPFCLLYKDERSSQNINDVFALEGE